MLGLERALERGGESVLGWWVVGIGEAAAALVGFGEENFLEEGAKAKLLVREGLGERLEHLRMGGRIVGMVEVERFDEATSHEHPPETVREILGKEGVLVRRDALREMIEGAKLRNAGMLCFLIGWNKPALGFGKIWDGDFFCEGYARTGCAFGSVEHGSELEFSGDETFTEPLCFESLTRFVQLEVLEDHEQAIEIDLFIIIHSEMLMALGALEIDAEEESSHVTCEAGVVGLLLADFVEPLGEEEGSALFCFVGEIGSEDLAHEDIERAVFGDGFGEKPHPVVIFASAFHPLHIERFCKPG